MARKITPQTAKAYAEYLYMKAKCTGAYVGSMNDFAVIESRVNAFIDGVNWQKRKAAALNRGTVK